MNIVAKSKLRMPVEHLKIHYFLRGRITVLKPVKVDLLMFKDFTLLHFM
jgi:hypothetical protein